MAQRTCSVNDCGEPHIARGWCWNHYQSWRRYGDPLTVERRKAERATQKRLKAWKPGIAAQLWARMVIDDNGCWLWQGTLSPAG